MKSKEKSFQNENILFQKANAMEIKNEYIFTCIIPKTYSILFEK